MSEPRRRVFSVSFTVAGNSDRLRKLNDYNLRRSGRLRALVLQQITAGEDPTPGDLATVLSIAAIDPAQDDTAKLLDYVARKYVLGRPRKTGPKRRTLANEAPIVVEYHSQLVKARDAFEADSRQPKAFARVAKAATAAVFGIKPRTVERAIEGLTFEDHVAAGDDKVSSQ